MFVQEMILHPPMPSTYNRATMVSTAPASAAHIRAVVHCVFRHRGALLLVEGYDEVSGQHFFRPLGGKVAFGEYSWEAVRRRIRQETGEEVKNLTFIGPSENLFEYQGQTTHEISFMFEGEFSNSEVYRKGELTCQGPEGRPYTAVWKSAKELVRQKALIVPEGLLEMVEGK